MQKTMMNPELLGTAAWDAIKRLSPRYQLKNPVMFVVWLGSLLTTGLFIQALMGKGEAPTGFILAVSLSLSLWFTVLFANFAEAMAEGRGKAQAAALKGLRKSVWAKKLVEPRYGSNSFPQPSEDLRKDDVVWQRRFSTQLGIMAPDIDLISVELGNDGREPSTASAAQRLCRKSSWREYALGMAAVMAVTLLTWPLRDTLELANIVIFFFARGVVFRVQAGP